jgi:pimeloyl-ACP methyl ester carboxylesterase
MLLPSQAVTAGSRLRYLGAPPQLVVLVVTVVVVTAGCGSSPSGAPGVATPTTSALVATPVALPAPPPVVWSTCPSQPALQCGTLAVPVDYRHPQGAMVTLALTRVPALDPSVPDRTLVFNPGGPGESGNQILPIILGLFPVSVRRQFSIVSFDPRGTGASDPIQCGTPPSAITSVLPVPSAAGQPLPGTNAFTAMARACATRAASLEPFINTINTARDMDRIRQAIGASTISFYGMSYGTVLGAVYADLFPHRVDTMVLDGAVDVNAPLTQQAEEEAPAAEQSLDHLFATCQQQAECPLGADPPAFFRSLVQSLNRHPLAAPGGGDPYPVTVGDLDGATLFALSVPGSTGSYYNALVAADHGNGTPLRTLSLGFAEDIDGAPLVDPQWTITCNDAATHPSPVAAGNLAGDLGARYPLIGAYSVTYTMGGCVSWPAARQPVVNLHPQGTPPVLVIGNTGDPNTPIIGAKHLAAVFPSARQLTWKGWGHTWLLSGPTDVCMQQLVGTYLSSGNVPPSGTVCD